MTFWESIEKNDFKKNLQISPNDMLPHCDPLSFITKALLRTQNHPPIQPIGEDKRPKIQCQALSKTSPLDQVKMSTLTCFGQMIPFGVVRSLLDPGTSPRSESPGDSIWNKSSSLEVGRERYLSLRISISFLQHHCFSLYVRILNQ